MDSGGGTDCLPMLQSGLVIAHPDDEAMFFLPSIKSLQEDQGILNILCLSNGDYEGLGHIREKEMMNSCRRLGIDEARVSVINDPTFQDGYEWDHMCIRNYIDEFVKHNDINEVWTFDEYGVSHHPNHISTYMGVSLWWEDFVRTSTAPTACQMNALVTVPWIRKYLGPLEYVYKRFYAEKENETVKFCPYRVFEALLEHKTQLKWYRVLHAVFSRYSYVNTWIQSVKRAPTAPITPPHSAPREAVIRPHGGG
eukprot:GHVO01041211.1.p1 GENE.GHVO01041211.1~~GHVO01041211.1.p1  ORF type:complete len:253 (-),score=37.74 GHVO01041211.1:52-810(-)